MPYGKGTYGKKVGRPPMKKKKEKNNGSNILKTKTTTPPPPLINKSQDAEQSRLDSERKEKNRQAMARKQRKQRGGIKLLLSDREDSVLGLGNKTTLG